jgi:hypothetical protein
VPNREHETKRSASNLAREQLTREHEQHVERETDEHLGAQVKRQLNKLKIRRLAEQNRGQVEPTAEENATTKRQPFPNPSNMSLILCVIQKRLLN